MQTGSGKWAAVIILSSLAYGQANPPPSGAVAPADKVLDFLSRTVSWYRQLAIEQKLVTQPSDLTFVQENQRVADQVVELAFNYARNQAQLQAKQAQPSGREAGGSAEFQGLAQAAQKVEGDIQQTQGEVHSLEQKLARSPQNKRAVEAQIAETESELRLLEARKEAIEGMVEFVNTSSSGPGAAGLRAQVEELARSVPPTLSRNSSAGPSQSNPEPTPALAGSTATKTQASGIWGLTADLIRLTGKAHSVDDEISATSELEKAALDLSSPFVDSLRNLVHQGDQLFAAADTSSPAQLAEERQQLDALTAQFKQTSSGLLPLSKLGVLLKIYQTTLKNWRESIHDEQHDELRQLLLRVSVLLALVAVVFGGGAVWRRATFRYVHDARRRNQFLLMRRFVTWILVGLILALTFATQLGSVVTFAGLLTAGVAVAMQNVILSVVGYFFLIGKYGIKVGDRVQISGVTGEVVDIGLVRIHLMELGGPGDFQPSGRIVAFSNSIVFQPTAGVFKQIPGTNFVWHEVKLTLGSGADYHNARQRITEAVEEAFRDSREELEAQRRLVEQSLSTVSPAELEPRIRLHYVGSGMEVSVRFPVELGKAAEIDDRLMRALIAAIDREPKLQLVGTETSTVKAEA